MANIIGPAQTIGWLLIYLTYDFFAEIARTFAVVKCKRTVKHCKSDIEGINSVQTKVMESEPKKMSARTKTIYKSFSLRETPAEDINSTPIEEKGQHLGSRKIASDVGGLFGVKPLLSTEDMAVTDPAIQYKGVIDHLK